MPKTVLPLLLSAVGVGAWFVAGCSGASSGAREDVASIEQADEADETIFVDGVAPTSPLAFTLIFVGRLDAIERATFNGLVPPGDLLRVTVSGCPLESLRLHVVDSLHHEIAPAPLGLGQSAGGKYAGLWQLPAPAYLTQLTLLATTLDGTADCRALVEQSKAEQP